MFADQPSTDRPPDVTREGELDRPEAMRRIVRAACRAPSVHNTQPWTWRLDRHAIELRADRSRQLPVTDPTGRNLTISCGGALHHLQVAASAFGYATEVERLPDPEQPEVFARVTLSPATVPADASARLAAMADRCTDRRRFTSWPIPDVRLEALADHARRLGASVIPLTAPGLRIRAELLVNRALEIQRRQPEVAAEVAGWIDHVRPDGVPLGVLGQDDSDRGRRATRFEERLSGSSDQAGVEGTDGLIVIATGVDRPIAWLQAGEATSALWLHATATGLSVVPLSQIVEVDETRESLKHDVLQDAANPQLMLRIGWQEIGRATLPRTPRRGLAQVLVP
ncbi:MAG: hypothetical protein JWP74_568 [Marmoricola sp.]|nr:hypothetical protein [Marmoricola sp.]